MQVAEGNSHRQKKRVLFVYTGYEQGSWGTIAFSRPAHYYIMPGILCCISALKADRFIAERCDLQYRYFNRTVESLETIFAAITEEHWDLVGFSSYCWNVQDHTALAKRLKALCPGTQVLFGGPEVFLEDARQAAAYFDSHPFVDGVVLGDAEKKLAALVRALLFADECAVNLDTVHGFVIPRLAADFENAAAADLNELPSIYPFDIQVRRSPSCGLAMVYETGRGCPNRCIFCKFGHRSTKAIRIGVERVERELRWLFGQKIECIHVADAVFDLSPDYAKQVCRVMLQHNIRTSIFVYSSPARVDDELASLYAATQSQVCVGIQSTNAAVLKILRRAHNPELFTRGVALLARHGVNFYIDLIFGLPGDNVSSFTNSFNEVVGMRPAFVMLFPLVLIKGTELADQAERYEMVPCGAEELLRLRLLCDISYENVALYREFGCADLEAFDAVALTVFFFYNRFQCTLLYLVERSGLSPFQVFRRIGEKTKDHLRATGMRVVNTTATPGFDEKLFEIFGDLLGDVAIGEQELRAFKDLFHYDIVRLLLLNSPQRERVFDSLAAKHVLAPGERTIWDDPAVRVVRSTYGKIVNIGYALPDLLGLASLQGKIAPRPSAVLIHAPYSSWKVVQQPLTPLERFLVEYIPETKGVRVPAVLQAAFRQLKSDDRETAPVRETLLHLVQEGIFSLYRQE